MSFRQLLQGSESGRKQRGRQDVRPQSMKVTSMDGREAWTFNYKSNPSTTGHRWHGYVQFFKEDVRSKDNAMQLDCMVDCDCPDYRFRYAYNNAQADVGRVGAAPEGWPYANQNNGQKPRPRSQGGVGDYGVGLCKHLCSLSDHLRTVVEPIAPTPEEPVRPTPLKKPIVNPTPPSQKPQTSNAPDPDDDTYTDSRTGSDTLTEGASVLYERIDNFVKSHPEFEVMYEGEDED